MTWRVGKSVPINVYEGDKPMFQCHTPEDAARIVALLNKASGAFEFTVKKYNPDEAASKLNYD